MSRLACSMLMLLALSSPRAGGLPAEDGPRFDHSDLDAILRAVVRGEGVDYPLLRESRLDALEAYLARAEASPLEGMPARNELALYINVYNASVLRAVAKRHRPGYSASEDSFGLFDEPLVRIGGKTISLNHLEHEIIRPRFGDPRIHAALVCAARSCPPLIPRAYRADDLEEVLEANMRRFVLDPSRNRIDVEAERLELSRLFEWYAEDFGGRDGLASFVGRYAGRDVSAFHVTFQEYSWELNSASGE